MAIFSNKKIKEIPSNQNTVSFFEALNGNGNENNKIYNENNINELTPVNGIIEEISSIIGGLPIYLYKRTGASIERVEDKELYYTLNVEPSNGMTGFNFKKDLTKNILLRGKTYAYSPYEENRKVLVVPKVLNAKDVIDVKTGLKLGSKYQFKINQVDLEKTDFECGTIKFKDNGVLNSQKFLNRIGKIYDYEADVFDYGLWSPGILSVDKINEEGQKNIGNAFMKRIKEKLMKFSPIILGQEAKWINIGRNPSEMLLDKIKEQVLIEVEQEFNLPTGFLSGKYNMVLDEKMTALKNFTIAPICTAEEEGLTNLLIPYAKRMNGYFLMFDLTELDRGTMETLVNNITKAVKDGVMTTNEGREKMNLSKVEGGDKLNIGLGSAMMDIESGDISVPNTGVGIEDTKELDLEDTKVEDNKELDNKELDNKDNEEGTTEK